MPGIDETVIFDLSNKDFHLLGLLASLKRTENEKLNTPTRLKDDAIEYNATLLEELESKGKGNAALQVLAEILHCALFHPQRKKMVSAMDDPMADLAFDLAVFSQIAKKNRAFPQPSDYDLPDDLSAEEYYYLLVRKEEGKNQQQQPQGGGGKSNKQSQSPSNKGDEDKDEKEKEGQGNGDGEPEDGEDESKPSYNPKGNKTPQDHHQWDKTNEIQQQVSNIKLGDYLDKIASRGTDPLGIKRLFQLSRKPQEKWYEVLSKVIGRKVSLTEKRYTTKKYSRRFGMPFQGKVNIKKGDIAIAIDTSGSITDVDMNEFLTRIYYIAKMWKNKIRILIGDCEVYSNVLIRQPKDVLQLKIEGYGGTSSKPFFEVLRKTPPCLLIFFTDLETDFPDEMPPFPVLWATENMNKDIPFGKKFKIELERKSNA